MDFAKYVQHKMEAQLWWARVMVQVGAIACWIWVTYLVFAAHGLFMAVLAFLAFALVCTFGVSAMFAIAASVVCFAYNAAGLWLPLAAYVLAGILAYASLKGGKLGQRIGV